MQENFSHISYLISVCVTLFLMVKFIDFLLKELAVSSVPEDQQPAGEQRNFRSIFRGALLEKNLPAKKDGGSPKEEIGSFSRVAGALGAFGLSVLFVGFGFWMLFAVHFPKHYGTNNELLLTVKAVQNFILAGSAMFFPYAVNQITSIFSAGDGAQETKAETKADGGKPNN